MKEQFTRKDFRKNSLAIIGAANEILEEYQSQGFRLTLRQLYYQFVARDLIPNLQSEYKRVCSIINDARLAGLMDWRAIEDTHKGWANTTIDQFYESAWAGQKYRPEVWVEKASLIGTVEHVCHRLRVPYFACGGYASQSEQYEAGKRFARIRAAGSTPIVLHLGDHDPSGLDMTKDLSLGLSMFARSEVEVVRLALNMSQIEEYSVPPNPIKDVDSRFASYAFGSSWELDALEPSVIDGLIAKAIFDLWNARLQSSQ